MPLHYDGHDPGPPGRRSGPITDLQHALRRMDVGALPRFGADGHLGLETWTWLQLAADRLGIDPLPPPIRGAEVFPDLVLALLAPDEPKDAPPVTVTPECSGLVCQAAGGFQVYDLRQERVPARPAVRMASSTRPHIRGPHRVTGITLHQTAARFSVGPNQLRAAKGDRALALAERALKIAYHTMVFCEAPDRSHGPLIVPSVPLLWHTNHANELNPMSLGLAIDGLYAGLMNDPRTLWGGQNPTPLMESTLEAARAALRWAYEHGRHEGMPLRYLWAHRQASPGRRSDPGEWLWRNLATWARDHLRLEWQPNKTWGQGRPLPAGWGVPGSAKY
jgi:hypothetical protein